jgi:signal transduction histidine kinase
MKKQVYFFLLMSIFFADPILGQQNGSLFLSSDTLKKYSRSYEVDQYGDEHIQHPERFNKFEWKYHPGDDISWKEPIMNDSNWTITRTDFSFDSVRKEDWQGIGWFRLKLNIDSFLYDQSIALVITHYGASEIYLDGKLISHFGVPSADPATEKTLRPLFAQPVTLVLDHKPSHILAIRYSFLRATNIFKKYGILTKVNAQYGSPGFLLYFTNAENAIVHYGNSLTNNLLIGMITLCVLLIIGVFNFFLYLFYSGDKLSLYMSIYTFVLAGHSFTKFLPTYTHLGLEAMIVDNFLRIAFESLWIPASMLAYYSVFYKKLPKYVWLYFIVTPLLGFLWIYNYSMGGSVATWVLWVVFVDMIRLFIQSNIKAERYSWIVIIGVLLSQWSLVLIFLPSISIPNTFNYYLVFMAYLPVPVALSIVNAIRTARANLNLEKQLEEVKRLSELSIAQQQEKQQILTAQKETLETQVEERTAELKHSLEELQSTQKQLIQQEKMVSLGEMTAGIAHEIQNPLNFVNNFSEVNAELLSEVNEQIKEGNLDEVQKIVSNIFDNERKIIHHGKRADSIVRNMLQHSRTSTGQKEYTDINALADEYLRLSYHGFRAKDPSFHVAIKADLDKNIGEINIIPQDIGRVFLNLLNNAFYAVTEKKIKSGDGYEPVVSLSSKKTNGKVEIWVKDNGAGIPNKVLDKIFQPFFTTKPTGEGTGLGLSLSYDVIKAHGGEIKVNTKEGEGSEFIIHLPV